MAPEFVEEEKPNSSWKVVLLDLAAWWPFWSQLFPFSQWLSHDILG